MGHDTISGANSTRYRLIRGSGFDIFEMVGTESKILVGTGIFLRPEMVPTPIVTDSVKDPFKSGSGSDILVGVGSNFFFYNFSWVIWPEKALFTD